jgi:hypothetical protein
MEAARKTIIAKYRISMPPCWFSSESGPDRMVSTCIPVHPEHYIKLYSDSGSFLLDVQTDSPDKDNINAS